MMKKSESGALTWDGYIVRSYNGWDSDTIYRWQKLANGKIIWRKEKA